MAKQMLNLSTTIQNHIFRIQHDSSIVSKSIEILYLFTKQNLLLLVMTHVHTLII